MSPRKAITVGLSGASCSGKTTLARLLRDVFPDSFILHEDDFYKPESELPTKEGFKDWDCEGAIAVPNLLRALEHIRETGSFPPFVDSKEDQNPVGTTPTTAATIESVRQKITSWFSSHSTASLPRLCILDGFLLYPPPPSTASSSPSLSSLLHPLSTRKIDIPLFLRVPDFATVLQRRGARQGYVTLEGFWTDPPGYVQKVVWPNYAESHAWLYVDGDVEKGVVDRSRCEERGILVQEGSEEKGGDGEFDRTLIWAVEKVMKEVDRLIGFGKKGEH